MGNINNTVVEALTKEKVVTHYISLFGKNEDPDNLKDLEQDIYLKLLTMDEDQLNNLVKLNKVNDFVFIMVKNNILSKTSPYYLKYKKNKAITIPLEDYDEGQ